MWARDFRVAELQVEVCLHLLRLPEQKNSVKLHIKHIFHAGVLLSYIQSICVTKYDNFCIRNNVLVVRKWNDQQLEIWYYYNLYYLEISTQELAKPLPSKIQLSFEFDVQFILFFLFIFKNSSPSLEKV